MQLNYLTDFNSLELCESTKSGVLGVVKGNFVFENKPSRNKRIYPTGLWEAVFQKPNVKHAIENNLMFGTVGHDKVNMDDLIRDAKVSHRTSNLKYNKEEGVGGGEIEILDTPVGKVLHTLLKSGSKMSVSTKAFGESFKKDNAGNDIIDDKNFFLERIDFVTDPGFLEAKPELREQLEEALKHKDADLEIDEHKRNKEIKKQYEQSMKNIKSKLEEGDSEMNELVEKLLKEKTQLESDLSVVTEKLGVQELRVKTLEKENTDLTTKNEDAQEILQDLTEQVTSFESYFDEIGEPEDIITCVNSSEKLTESLKKFGTIAELETLCNVVEAQNNRIAEITGGGTLDDVEEAIANMQGLVERLSPYETIDQLEEALDVSLNYMEEQQAVTFEDNVDELSATYGIEKEIAQDLLNKLDYNEAVATLNQLSDKDFVNDSDLDESANEDAPHKEFKRSGSLAGKLMSENYAQPEN